MTLGNRLRKARTDKGLTQEDLANMIGIAKSTLTGYERGNRSPDVLKIKALAEALSTTGDYLLGIPPDKDLGLANAERELVKQYRTLDPHGKEMVDIVLDKEYARTVAEKAKTLETKKEPAPKDEPEYIVMRIYNQSAAAGMGNYLVDGCEYDYDECECLMSDIPVDADMGFRISGDSMSPDINDGDIVWVKEQHQVDSGDVGIFTINGNSFCKRLKVDTSSRRAWLVSDNPNYNDIELKEYMNFRTIGLVLGVHSTN